MFDTPLITTRLNALLAALVLAAAAALVAGGGGYALGHRLAKADGDAALAKLQRAHAEATAKAADEARLRLVAEVERNNRLAQALADEKATHAQEKQSLLRRIANVTTVYVPAAGLDARRGKHDGVRARDVRSQALRRGNGASGFAPERDPLPGARGRVRGGGQGHA